MLTAIESIDADAELESPQQIDRSIRLLHAMDAETVAHTRLIEALATRCDRVRTWPSRPALILGVATEPESV